METLQEIWFVTGSQHLYGEATLKKVEENSIHIVKSLNDSKKLPLSIEFKTVVTTPQKVFNIISEANTSSRCIGLIFWMHTFSPAKMWINGLNIIQKPFLHLHTQFNQEIPWDSIDMDFMNLNQAAHGDREFGFICTRMNKNRKVVVGHWSNDKVQEKIAMWMRVVSAWADMRNMKIARFGDNMREVAVTEGNKVSGQIQFGISVNGYGVGDLVKVVNQVEDSEVAKLVEEYYDSYIISEDAKKNGPKYHSVLDAARIELGMRKFLSDGNFKAFTTTFEDLHGLKQLPGIAVQRLMNDGYGFGAEGDWKTSAIVRAVKTMANGLDGGTSFMEDYTYHFNQNGDKVLGSHMLEICPSIAAEKPKLEVHPLSIGGKEDPARLVFNVNPGKAINVSLIDLGNRFRLITNEVDAVNPDKDLPNLPVARVMWIPKPNLEIGAEAWIYAGGAHHTVFSKAITKEYIEDFAEIANIEHLLINDSTNISDFKKELRFNETYFK